jgi:hypothetical protein
MGNRTTRFWVAVLLTGMDIAVFQHFFGVIWQAWPGVEWIRMVLLFTLALWAGSLRSIFPTNESLCILAHMNADHVDAMILLARAHAGIEATEATMTSVDRLGFSLKLKTKDGVKSTRINFLREVATSQDTRAVLVEMVRQVKA